MSPSRLDSGRRTHYPILLTLIAGALALLRALRGRKLLMSARCCDHCGHPWPNVDQYKDCPLCEHPTELRSKETPLTPGEVFRVRYMQREKERQARGEPSPELIGQREGRKLAPEYIRQRREILELEKALSA